MATTDMGVVEVAHYVGSYTANTGRVATEVFTCLLLLLLLLFLGAGGLATLAHLFVRRTYVRSGVEEYEGFASTDSRLSGSKQ